MCLEADQEFQMDWKHSFFRLVVPNWSAWMEKLSEDTVYDCLAFLIFFKKWFKKKKKKKAELTTLAYIITYWGFYVILQGSDDSMNGCAGCVLGSSHTGLETSWCPVDNNWSLKKNMHFMTGINSCLTIPCSMEILLAIALVASRLPELPQFEWKTATCLQQVGDSFQNCRKKNWAFINFNILFVFCSYLFPRLSYRNDKLILIDLNFPGFASFSCSSQCWKITCTKHLVQQMSNSHWWREEK